MIRPFDVLPMALAVLTGIILTLAGMKMARAHDPYTSWMVPGTVVSCCNKKDCRPTRARMDGNEQWEAWDGDRWVKVPPERVLTIPNPDGRSHLCEMNGTVYCFMPGETKS